MKEENEQKMINLKEVLKNRKSRNDRFQAVKSQKNLRVSVNAKPQTRGKSSLRGTMQKKRAKKILKENRRINDRIGSV